MLNYQGDFIKKVFIFDYFYNEKSQEIKIGFRFIFQSKNSTLKSSEIDIVYNNILRDSLNIDGVEIPGLSKWMAINKKNITQGLSKKFSISSVEASHILDFFVDNIKSEAILKKVKLSGFGSFSFKKTPKRVGRNPKTKESYIINERVKLNFKPSNKVKGIFNLWKKLYYQYA